MGHLQLVLRHIVSSIFHGRCGSVCAVRRSGSYSSQYAFSRACVVQMEWHSSSKPVAGLFCARRDGLRMAKRPVKNFASVDSFSWETWMPGPRIGGRPRAIQINLKTDCQRIAASSVLDEKMDTHPSSPTRMWISFSTSGPRGSIWKPAA